MKRSSFWGTIARLWLFGAAIVGAPILGMMLSAKRDSVARAADASANLAIPAPGTTTAAADHGYVGVLLTPFMATLAAPSEARVETVRVVSGQAVRKGDVLVELDRRSLALEVEGARATLRSLQGAAHAARAEVSEATASARRRREAKELVGQEDAERAESARRSAIGRLAAAEGQVAAQKARVLQLQVAADDAAVKAPFDGYVATVLLPAGTTARRGEPLVRMVGGDGLRVKIAIPESEAGKWKDHRRARLTLGDGRSFWAILEHAPIEPDEVARSYFVEGRVVTSAEQCPGSCTLLGGHVVSATLVPDRE